MNATDEILVSKTLEGSLDAFDVLMRRHERLVYKVAFSYVGSRENALDVSQNVFLKVYDRLGSFDGRGSFKAWLMRIAYHESVNWVYAQKRHQRHEPLDDGAELEADDDPRRAFLERERRRRVMAEVERLSPRGRLAVLLRYFQSLPIREVAAALECSEGVAKSILFRSVRRMRDAMAGTD